MTFGIKRLPWRSQATPQGSGRGRTQAGHPDGWRSGMPGPQLTTYQEEQERRRRQNLVPRPRRSRSSGASRPSATRVTTGGRSGVSCPRSGAQLGQTRPGALEEEGPQGRSRRGLGRRRGAGRVLTARAPTPPPSLQPRPSGHFRQPRSGRKEELPHPSGDATLLKAATVPCDVHGCLPPT